MHPLNSRSSNVFSFICFNTPTRLHTKWHGPYRVVSFEDSEYVLANLITHKERSTHIKNLKVFNYDPSIGVPADTARRDTWNILLRKFLLTQGTLRNRLQCPSMSNGSTMTILITHGSLRLETTKVS